MLAYLREKYNINFHSCLPVASCLLFCKIGICQHDLLPHVRTINGMLGYVESIEIASLRCLTDRRSECRTTGTASPDMKRELSAAYVYIIIINNTPYGLFIVYGILNEFCVQEYQWQT